MEFKHFSHPHNLTLYQLAPGQNFPCSGCQFSCSSCTAYGCAHCQFFLHEQCGRANRTMQHPAHSSHHLTLIPHSTHSFGSFMCDACGVPGSGFSFCCALCDFDLHVRCASLPLKAKYEVHPHELSLNYALPINEATPQSCNVCHKILDSKLWTYSCNECNFHVHTSCADKKLQQEAAYQANREPFGSYNVPTQNYQPKPTPTSSRPYVKTHADLFNQQLARVNESIDALGYIGSSSSRPYVKTRTDIYDPYARLNASLNTLGRIG
ncbi:putative Cysteine/Histidine-rich C1 domain family protein [Melia azedarach]|uniref:Cysteine/Histidine-rich C1 domain family protein n=1 Tax=Melia azedarach TaxID=155640 RepID=A0ACC1X5T8_MELAZ|nr:putative Cysteine/Histidine-rich C1 domain family protein [Melia azedarach]